MSEQTTQSLPHVAPEIGNSSQHAPAPKRPGRRRVLNVRLLVITLILAGICLPVSVLWYRHQKGQTGATLLNRATAHQESENWPAATAYYQRYLMLRPDDMEARFELVNTYTHQAQRPQSKRRLVALLYQTLGLAPGKDDLRLLLAETLLEIGEYATAQEEAEKLIASKSPHVMAAQRVIAISLSARARSGDSTSIEKAIDALMSAVERTPSDVQLAALTAQILRIHPEVAKRKEIDPPVRADHIIDQMVEANPGVADALLTRYQYRRKYHPDKSPSDQIDSDLQLALQSDPDHVEGLLFSAAAIDSQGRAQGEIEQSSEQVEQILRHVIDVAPLDPRGYLALAKALGRAGDQAGAVSILQQGQPLVARGNVELEIALIEALQRGGRQKDADELITKLEETASALLPTLSAKAMRRIENKLRLIRARQSLANNALQPAIGSLKSILATEESETAEFQTIESLQALELLARAMSSLNRWDAAAGYWERLSQQAPGQQEPARLAAEAYLKLGQADAAIRHLEILLSEFTEHPENIDAQIRVLLAQAHFKKQLQLPTAKQKWTEFEAAFQEATQYADGSWELPLLKVDYLLAKDGNNQADAIPPAAHEQLMRELHEAESRFSQESDFWNNLAFAYLRLEQSEEANRALLQFESIEPSLRNRILARSEYLARLGQFEEAEKYLIKSQKELIESEQPTIVLQRIRILVSAGELKSALTLVNEFIAANSDDQKFLTIGIEISLRLEDFITAKKYESALGKLELADTFELQTLRIRRLLASYDQASRDEQNLLEGLIESVRIARPRWYQGVAFEAQHAELIGNQTEAINLYRQAVELGDDRATTLEKLVFLLYQAERYSESDQYLSRLVSDHPDNSRADSLAISLAIQSNRLVEALELAHTSAQKHPEDPIRQVWLGNLLALNQQPADAERTLRDAVVQFKEDPRVWSGLFAYLVRTQATEEARKILGEMADTVKLDEATRHFTVAQGYLTLGDMTEALYHYRQAVKVAPDNTFYRLHLARHLMKTDVTSATEQFENILQREPTNSEARRQLATLLAARGDNSSYQRAVQLLQQQASDSHESRQPDNRLRAALLMRRGKTRQERIKNVIASRQILEAQFEQSGELAEDVDHLLLAGIYEQEASLRENPITLQTARDQLRHLVDRSNPSVKYLQIYLNFLLRHIDATLAVDPETLSQTLPASDLSGQQKLQIRQAFLRDARLRISELDSSLQREGTESNLFVLVRFKVRLLLAEGHVDDATAVILSFAEANGETLESDGEEVNNSENLNSEISIATKNQKARLHLNVGNLYTMLGNHELAEQWYRKLVTIAPSTYAVLVQSLAKQGRIQEAAQLCLEASDSGAPASAAAVLARLFTTVEHDSESYQQAQPLIASALETHGDNVQLLLSIAVMQFSQGDNDEAINLFRRILELDPKHVLALNNLATLLGERPNDHAEALETIEQAIAISGRRPALLDTQGTIYIQAGELANAVECLEEAVAGSSVDPRYYFHLAAAYHQGGNSSKAGQAMTNARGLGLESAMLTSGDQELLNQLDQEYPPIELTN